MIWISFISKTKLLFASKKYKNEAENGSTPYSYNLLKDCNNFRTAIMNTCSEISCTPSFSYCDKQVIHIISEIQLSELLRILPKPNDFLLKFDFADILYMGLGKGYEQLVSIYKKLADLVDTRLSCQMLDISNDEIDEWKKIKQNHYKNTPNLHKCLLKCNVNTNKKRRGAAAV